MSGYLKLWEYVAQSNKDTLKLSFEDIERISGNVLNHSFLNHKKELLDYGYEVKKISMKDKDIVFSKNCWIDANFFFKYFVVIVCK